MEMQILRGVVTALVTLDLLVLMLRQSPSFSLGNELLTILSEECNAITHNDMFRINFEHTLKVQQYLERWQKEHLIHRIRNYSMLPYNLIMVKHFIRTHQFWVNETIEFEIRQTPRSVQTLTGKFENGDKTWYTHQIQSNVSTWGHDLQAIYNLFMSLRKYSIEAVSEEHLDTISLKALKHKLFALQDVFDELCDHTEKPRQNLIGDAHLWR